MLLHQHFIFLCESEDWSKNQVNFVTFHKCWSSAWTCMASQILGEVSGHKDYDFDPDNKDLES